MDFGVYLFPTDYSISPPELARTLEERGYAALLFPEHTHIPASRETPWPWGGDLPREYFNLHDPFVALTAAAAATKTLKIGTGVCLVIEHDPIVLAKVVASVDVLSGGRFLFGVGGGWNREEMANHGTDFPRRWKVLRERIEAMKVIWTEEEATYHGEFVNFDAIWSYPKPAQKPHPPVIVGGNGERTLRRVVRYGDEWMPTNTRGELVIERIPELQEMAAKAGRGPIPVSVFGGQRKPVLLEAFRAAGIHRVFFPLPSDGRDAALTRLDQLDAVIRELG